MALSYESNVDLGFDTEVLRAQALAYEGVAEKLTNLTEELNGCLEGLKDSDSGWTTPAGTLFHELVNDNWSKNIKKYVALLMMLSDCLTSAADQYENLVDDTINTAKL